MKLRVKDLAEVMYHGYRDSCDWKAVNGDELPVWTKLPKKIRKHWIKAAKYGLEEIGYQIMMEV